MIKDDEIVKEIKKRLYEYPKITDKTFKLKREIDYIKESMEAARQITAVCFTGSPKKGGITDITYLKAQKITDEYETRILKLFEDVEILLKEQEEISKCLDTLSQTERSVIEARYFKRMKWDNMPYSVHLSRMTCFRTHDKALEKIKNFMEGM